jgi:ATP-binding cassette subfamily F protein 3
LAVCGEGQPIGCERIVEAGVWLLRWFVGSRQSVRSGGEKSRVGRACILGKKANLVMLDEPTNHLDMNSIACLTKALQDYSGTVVFVSHDRDFIDAICTHVFVMTKDGRAMLFEGNIDDYQLAAANAGFPDVFQVDEEGKTSSAKKKEKSPQKEKEREKELNQTRKLVQKLEEEMGKMTKEIQTCDENLLKAASDHQKCYELASRKLELETQLQKLEDQWLKASEALSKA